MMPNGHRKFTTLDDLLTEYVSPEPNTGCWLWLGAVDRHGYGVISRGGKVFRAHRLVFGLSGRLLDAERPLLLHRCDNRLCVNPDHCLGGTHADNTNDMMKKGRGRNQYGPLHAQQGEHHQ